MSKRLKALRLTITISIFAVMKMEMKRIYILGDSYSTFDGFIPEGNASWYHENYENPDQVTDVFSAKDTWWQLLAKETGAEIVLNDSWSGSTVSYYAYDGRDCSGDSSFICRFEKTLKENFFAKEEIDTAIIFGGTNDSWTGGPIGEVQYSDYKKEDLFSFLPALCYLFERLNETGVKNKLFVLNTELKPTLNEGVIIACEHYGITLVRPQYIDKLSGHPSKAGMIKIKEEIEKII